MGNAVTLPDLLDLITRGGATAGLLIFIWAGMTRRIVYGWLYDAKQKECEEWKALALSGTRLAEKAVSQAEAGRHSQ